MIQGVVADTGLAPPEVDASSSRPDFVDPLKQKGGMQRTGVAGVVNTAGTEALLQRERNRQVVEQLEDEDDEEFTARVQSMRFEDPRVTGISSSGPKGKAYVGKQINVGGGDACRACGKAVGFADKVTGIGGKWHKDCFRCQYCQKTLANAGDALEADGKPTCPACYKKNHPSSRKN